MLLTHGVSPIRVHHALNQWEKRKFDYGDADCCQFIAFVVKHLTGKDYAIGFQYKSEAEADLLIKREGELVDFIGNILGKPSAQLTDGDPCVVAAPIVGQVCGIKLGNKVVCLTTGGFAQIPDKYLVCGWSVLSA
jgi:hypothetical protein